MSITDVIAACALVLSMLSLYLQWKDKQPRLKIRLQVVGRSLPVGPPDPQGQFSQQEVPMLCIHLANPTDAPIPVTAVQIRVNHKTPIALQEFHLLGTPQPQCVAKPHDAREYYVRGKELAGDLDKVGIRGHFHAVVEIHDEFDRTYSSKLTSLSTEELAET